MKGTLKLGRAWRRRLPLPIQPVRADMYMYQKWFSLRLLVHLGFLSLKVWNLPSHPTTPSESVGQAWILVPQGACGCTTWKTKTCEATS